jgi:hypothetical protein
MGEKKSVVELLVLRLKSQNMGLVGDRIRPSHSRRAIAGEATAYRRSSYGEDRISVLEKQQHRMPSRSGIWGGLESETICEHLVIIGAQCTYELSHAVKDLDASCTTVLVLALLKQELDLIHGFVNTL